ncbi:MAG: hypothetical protein HDS27_06255 [Bacteroides sp.]|nr:hypothetical protein [Bacteroides sp.]
MKILLSLTISFLCCLSALAFDPVEYFNAGNPIKYCGTKYYLAWTANPVDNYYVQEYLPKGESLEHYNQMFSVSVTFCEELPLESVNAKIYELDQRKQTDPITNYTMAENNGDYILEFIVSDSPSGTFSTVEVDVHYYRQMTINGRNAIVLCFYSSRAYGDDIKPFIMSIPGKRVSWYEEMSKLKINPTFSQK